MNDNIISCAGFYALKLSLRINQEIGRGDNLFTGFDSPQHFHAPSARSQALPHGLKGAVSFVHIETCDVPVSITAESGMTSFLPRLILISTFVNI